MAETKEQAIAGIIADVAQLNVDDVVHWHCYHKRHGDRLAQKACKPFTLAATRALIADLPSLADGLVTPAFLMKAVDETARPGQSGFGGMPDVPADFVWPLSHSFTVEDATQEYHPVSSLGPAPMDAPLPLTFIAQLDLSALSPETPDLPNEGRLLIFMDYAVWFEGEDNARTAILWDRTPAADLRRHAPPEALVWLDGLARQHWQAFQDDMNASFGDDHEDMPFASGFLPPETPVELEWSWQRLPSQAIELVQSDYDTRREATGAADIYRDVAMEWPQEDEDRAPPYHQILGVPFPDQDDPRYDAYYQSVLGRPVITSEDFDEVRSMIGAEGTTVSPEEAEQALKFQLLLQLDVASFLNMNAEGHFYFFLHEDDLAARNFDAVIVIYQQT